MRFSLWVLAVLFAAGSACSSTDETPPDAPDCAVESFDDQTVVRMDAAISLGSEVQDLLLDGERVYVCGDGFVARIDEPAVDPIVIRDALFGGRGCSLAVTDDDRLLVATRRGVVAVTTLDGSPSVELQLERPDSELFSVAVDGPRVYLAAGKEGVVELRLSTDRLEEVGVLPGAQFALGVATLPGALLVADGFSPGVEGGAEVRLVDQSGSGALFEAKVMPGIASGVFVQGERSIVLRPGYGVDVYRVESASLELLTSVEMDGLPFDAALDGDTLVVASGSELQRIELGVDSADVVSIDPWPGEVGLSRSWFRTVAASASGGWVGIGSSVAPLAMSPPVPAPRLVPEDGTVTLVGGQTERLVRFRNLGSRPLTVERVTVSDPFSVFLDPELNESRPDCQGQFVVEPGRALVVTLRQSAKALVSGRLELRSNDPDRPLLTVPLEANRPTPSVGESVEDLVMPTVFGERFILSEHRGRVRLAKLYDPT